MSGARRSSVVERADRPVPGRPAAVVYAVTLLGVLAVARPLTHALWDTANHVPGALSVLREHRNPPAEARPAVRPAVVVLLDGLRSDRVQRMPALSRLARQGGRATVDLPHPTVSKAFYHAFLTGVPPRGSGVRTNRFDGPARLDSLADRVRAHGGRCTWVLEELDWLAVMHAEQPPDEVVSSPSALDEPLERALEQVGRQGRWLTVVHATRADAAAHDHGAASEAYAEALAVADDVVGRVAEATRGRDVVLAVLSDHGHIDPGGHGGAEEIVRRVPFVLRAPALDGERAPSELRVAHVAPTLAAWMGLPPPRSAVASAAPGLRPREPYPAAPEMARGRAALLERATDMERARRGRRRLWLVPLWLLLTASALGATKRAFSGFDRTTVIAPALWAALVLLAHRLIWDRPFSLSALDAVNRHATRLGLTSLVAAALAVIVAVAISARGSGAHRHTRIRRAAASTAWASLTAATFVAAWMGGAVGPWPSSPLLYYGAVLGPAAMAGACLAAAGALFATAWRADPALGA